MRYLEKVLEFNSRTNDQGFAIGNNLTYVDVALMHTTMAAASQFPAAFEKLSAETPRVVAHKEKIASEPKIAEYLKSDRRGSFEGNSMM